MKFWEAMKYLDENPGGKIQGAWMTSGIIYYSKAPNGALLKWEDNHPSWQISIDLDADWRVYVEGHNFEWALQQLRKKFPVQRKSWNDGKHLREGIRYLKLHGDDLSVADLFAEDWVLA